MSDLNIGRAFANAEAKLAGVLGQVPDDVKLVLTALFTDVKNTATTVVETVDPTLNDLVSKLESDVEKALNDFANAKTVAGSAVRGNVIDAVGSTAIAKIEAWMAAAK